MFTLFSPAWLTVGVVFLAADWNWEIKKNALPFQVLATPSPHPAGPGAVLRVGSPDGGKAALLKVKGEFLAPPTPTTYDPSSTPCFSCPSLSLLLGEAKPHPFIQ